MIHDSLPSACLSVSMKIDRTKQHMFTGGITSQKMRPSPEPTNQRTKSLNHENNMSGKLSAKTVSSKAEPCKVTTSLHRNENMVQAESTIPSLFRKRGTGLPIFVAVKAHMKARHVANTLKALEIAKQTIESVSCCVDFSMVCNVYTIVVQKTACTRAKLKLECSMTETFSCLLAQAIMIWDTSANNALVDTESDMVRSMLHVLFVSNMKSVVTRATEKNMDVISSSVCHMNIVDRVLSGIVDRY